MSNLTELRKVLEKGSQGEGSRGGRVIGHTKAGNPIYESAHHESHSQFSAKEHQEAMNVHQEAAERASEKASQARESGKKVPQKVLDFIQHHRLQAQKHQSKMSQKRGMKKSEDAPFYSAVIVVNPEKDKYLIGKRREDDIYTSPAGAALQGESPKEAAIREAFEEAGIRLTPGMLKELPVTNLDNGKVCHCFLACLKEYQNPSTVHDPDREVWTWRWYPMDKPLPEPMDENRKNSFVQAKMKLNGLKKSIQNLSKALAPAEIAHTDIDTANYSLDNMASDEESVKELESLTQGMYYGCPPKEICLNNKYNMRISKVDDGLFDAYVLNNDYGSTLYKDVMSQFDKMTLPSIVQSLKAKGFVSYSSSNSEKESASKINEQLTQAPQININIENKQEHECESKEDDSQGWKDDMSGGIADKKSPGDFDSRALLEGLRVELEHTDDPKLAMEIAMDHLSEDPEYYEKLESIESH